MKALSIINPWAWAIVNLPEPLRKDVENRDWYWPSMIGQRVAIHVSKGKYDDEAEEEFVALGFMDAEARTLARSQRGQIIGTAQHTAVLTRNTTITGGCPQLGDITRLSQICEGRWFEGEFGLVMEDVRVLRHGVLARGARGWWDVPADVLRQVAEELR